jgi:DNA-binding PucR family transcriptional regulator
VKQQLFLVLAKNAKEHHLYYAIKYLDSTFVNHTTLNIIRKLQQDYILT